MTDEKFWPLAIQKMLEGGNFQLEKKDYAEARECFELVLRKDKNNSCAMLGLGISAARQYEQTLDPATFKLAEENLRQSKEKTAPAELGKLEDFLANHPIAMIKKLRSEGKKKQLLQFISLLQNPTTEILEIKSDVEKAEKIHELMEIIMPDGREDVFTRLRYCDEVLKLDPERSEMETIISVLRGKAIEPIVQKMQKEIVQAILGNMEPVFLVKPGHKREDFEKKVLEHLNWCAREFIFQHRENKKVLDQFMKELSKKCKDENLFKIEKHTFSANKFDLKYDWDKYLEVYFKYAIKAVSPPPVLTTSTKQTLWQPGPASASNNNHDYVPGFS